MILHSDHGNTDRISNDYRSRRGYSCPAHGTAGISEEASLKRLSPRYGAL